MEAGRGLRVLVVDDDPTVRRGLSLVLRSEPTLTVVGEAIDGEDAVAQAERLKPDLVLMDLRMPRLDGLGATKRIKAADPKIRVIIISVYGDQIEAALAAGASNFLLKDSSVERLLEVVHSAPPRSGTRGQKGDDETDLGPDKRHPGSRKGGIE